MLFNIRIGAFLRKYTKIVALIVLIGSFFIAWMVRADSVIVNDPSGSVTDDALCSLPEAILDMYYPGEIAYQDCTNIAGSGTIELSTNVLLTDVYGLDENSDPNGLPCLGDNATVDGNGFTVERDSGAAEFRIFCTQNAANVTLQDITIKGGDVTSGGNGGGFRGRNIISLVVQDVTFESNSAENGGAIGLDSLPGGGSTVTIDDSYFTGNITDGLGSDKGGVLYSSRSDITVTDSYFYFNRPTTTFGGVFYIDTAESSLNVDRSNFENNVAGKGAVFYVKNGATLSVSNSTFDSNSPVDDGGIIYSFQDSGIGNNINFFYNTAQYNNGGSSGSQTFYNCIDDGLFNCIMGVGDSTLIGSLYIFENNLLVGGGCDGNVDNAIFTNNLGGGFGLTCGTNDVPTNIAGTAESNGGLWKTFSVASGSNAIDTGVSGTLGCPSLDGRGRLRPFNSLCDIGAYEFDEVGITFTETSGQTSVLEEGETSDTFSVYVDSYPTSSVTITPSYDSAEISVSPSSLTFTTSAWPETKTFTVTAVDDNSDEDDTYTKTIGFSVSSSDISYNNLSLPEVTVNITDNDSSPSTSGSTTSPSNPVTPPVIPITPVIPVIPVPPPEEPVIPTIPVIPVPPEEPVTPEIVPESIPEVPSVENNFPNSNEEDFIKKGNPQKEVLGAIKDFSDFVNNNISEAAKETVVVSGVVAPVLLFVAVNPGIVVNTVTLPIRILNLLPVWLGLKRRRRPWGVVYDSVTKQPLDPVYVTLYDQSGKAVFETITDMDGRFGFLVSPGTYTISVKKDNYEFPSKILSGKESDEVYGGLYLGSIFEVINNDEVIAKNIPMDQKSFNWNEFTKKQNPKLLRFYSRSEIVLAKLSSVLFILGFFSNSIIIIIGGFNLLNIFVLSLYGIFLILKMFGVKIKNPGHVTDREGNPLSFGLIKLYSIGLGVNIAKSVIGRTGKYYLLTPKGEYYAEIYKKTGEDSYQKVKTTEPMFIKNGYLGKNFKID